MNKKIVICCCILSLCLASCGASFGDIMLGVLDGAAGAMGGYGYGGYSGYSSYSGGNNGLSLNPNVAAAQATAQWHARQEQWNQGIAATTEGIKRQVEADVDQAYQDFCKYNKKPDGSNYTKAEWLEICAVQQASQQPVANTNVTFGLDNTSSSTSTTSSSSASSNTSSRRCPYCNNTGQIIVEQSVATYGNDNSKYCDICQKKTLSGYTHSHHSCKCGRPRSSGNIPTYNRIPW